MNLNPELYTKDIGSPEVEQVVYYKDTPVELLYIRESDGEAHIMFAGGQLMTVPYSELQAARRSMAKQLWVSQDGEGDYAVSSEELPGYTPFVEQ